MTWPATADVLVAEQTVLGRMAPEPWTPPERALVVGGCFVCFPRGEHGLGRRGDPAWAAAVVLRNGQALSRSIATGTAGAPYEPGLLALREGPLLESAVRGLDIAPEVLLVDATGRDHPRRAGLALHLGAVLDVPTIGVTHRPLAAVGEEPPDERGAASPLLLDGEIVGAWLRTRPGTRPLAVHAAWRTDPSTAVQVVMASLSGSRTPEPLRRARTLARTARAAAASAPA